VRPTLVAEEHILVAAFSDDTLAGTVQLIAKLPPNQPHRCEVSKLLVHPSFRKQGIARGLMEVLGNEARRLDKSLITLDTRTGDKAEGLYASLGFVAAGIIPNFALDPDRQKLHATTYMYKEL